MTITIALTDKKIADKKISCSKTHKGIFLRIGCCNVVDRIIGISFSRKRKFINDNHCGDWPIWKQFWYAIKEKEGFLCLIKYY